MATSPYPHVEIGVRDESIYTPTTVEELPLHMPLYMMRTVKGPIGVPKWCSTYMEAVRIFGEDTFNKRSEYFSEQAYFLLKTFPSNGAFIMRVADSESKCSEISIELGVSTLGAVVPQWLRDDTGRFMTELDGSKIPINNSGEECQPIPGQESVPVYYRALEQVAISGRRYFLRNANYLFADVTPATRRIINTAYFKGNGQPIFKLVGDNEAFDAAAFYFKLNDSMTGATPQFEITSETYNPAAGNLVKLIDWKAASGGKYLEIDETLLPELAPGQTVGDKFATIDGTEIVVESYDDPSTESTEEDLFIGLETSAEKYGSYVFTRYLNVANPYTYTEVTLPPGTSMTDRTYYYYAGEKQGGQLEDQAMLQGYKLAWRARVRTEAEKEAGHVPGSDTQFQTKNFKWYPMLDIVASNQGIWGRKFGIKLFFDPTQNTISGTVANSAVTYTLAPMQLIGEDTVASPITDSYQQTMVMGVVRPKAYDPDSDTDITIEKLLPLHYSGIQALPITCYWVPSNWNYIGKLLMAAEIANRAAIAELYPNVFGNEADPSGRYVYTAEGDRVFKTFVDALYYKAASEDDFGDGEAGFMANPISCIDSENIPYWCSCVVDGDDELVKTDTASAASTEPLIHDIKVPTASNVIFLGGGSDGDKADADIERYIRAQILAAVNQTQEYLIDYPRAPFNSIMDTGVSMATKKSYLDFMSVRDNLVVNLSTQQIWQNADGSYPVVNDRFTDESRGSSLRSYAWLMREDVANATEACRCKIFLHAGYTSDHEGPVAATLWIALKNAEYLNKDFIDKEPKELPNAAVECFTDLSWVASAADTKSRCWNAGLNYVQHYGMNKLWHYAAVRSVYKYETSILVDGGVVDALTFMKDIIRRSWATWSNSTRPVAELEVLIKRDLDSRFAHMLHGKFGYETEVYQTDEDVNLGYQLHVDAKLIAPGGKRVWKSTIICQREGFNGAGSLA